MTNEAEGRPEPMKHALEDIHDEQDSARKRMQSGASMEYVRARLLRIPPRYRFERGKEFTVQGWCTDALPKAEARIKRKYR